MIFEDQSFGKETQEFVFVDKGTSLKILSLRELVLANDNKACENLYPLETFM